MQPRPHEKRETRDHHDEDTPTIRVEREERPASLFRIAPRSTTRLKKRSQPDENSDPSKSIAQEERAHTAAKKKKQDRQASRRAAFFFPRTLSQRKQSRFFFAIAATTMGLAAEAVSSVLLFGLVLGMSATVELRQVRRQLRNRAALLIGLLLQFFLLPFAGFLVVKVFRFPPAVGITLLVVTSSPGGSYSNWWCSLFNASLALSVTMTAISTLLSTIMLPLNLMLYTRWAYSSDVVEALDWGAVFVSIAVVLGGIAAGLVGGRVARRRGQSEIFHRRANLFGNASGLALVSLSAAVSSSSHKAALWDQSAGFYVGCALPALLGLLVAVRLSTRFDLEKPERVAVAVESCYQNTGIATSVALTMFAGDESQLATAVGVPLYYGIVVAIMLAAFCVASWKMGWTKAPPDENLCKVLYNSYEVEPDPGPREAEVSIEVVYGGGEGEGEDGGGGCGRGDAVVFEQTDGSSYVVDEASMARKAELGRRARAAGQQRRSAGSSDEETADCSEASGEARRGPPGEESAGGGIGRAEEGARDEVGRIGRTIAVIRARATGYRTPHALTRPRSTDEHDENDNDCDNGEPGPRDGRGQRRGRRNPPPHAPRPAATYDPRILSALDEADDDGEPSGARARPPRPAAPDAPSSPQSPPSAPPDEPPASPAAQGPRGAAGGDPAPPRRPGKSYRAVPRGPPPDGEPPLERPRTPPPVPAEGRTID
jgi:predicted Na+-dependent transporter